MASNNQTSTLTFNLVRIFPDGGAGYKADGLKGTMYMKPGHFSGIPPATITLTGENLGIPVVAPAPKATEEAPNAFAGTVEAVENFEAVEELVEA